MVKIEEFSEISNVQSQMLICFMTDLDKIIYGRADQYYVNIIVSPVIEFSRSGHNPNLNRLISGRLWYQHKYWTKDKKGNDILLEKSQELEKLYNSLARWIKKYCKLLPNTNYIGPHAMELYKNGAELSP